MDNYEYIYSICKTPVTQTSWQNIKGPDTNYENECLEGMYDDKKETVRTVTSNERYSNS